MTTLAYEYIPVKENGDPLVVLKDADFILEQMYFHQGLSKSKELYLRKSVVKKLLKIQKKLKRYRFKIWDGYRSRVVQKNIYYKFMNELKKNHPDWDEKKLIFETSTFVTLPGNPNRIPPHATGGAIDLTLVDEEGKELNMGTDFDYFGVETKPLYYEKNKSDEKIKNNRKILRELMLAEDFIYDDDEWWHFNYGNQFWAVKMNKPFAFFGEAHV